MNMGKSPVLLNRHSENLAFSVCKDHKTLEQLYGHNNLGRVLSDDPSQESTCFVEVIPSVCVRGAWGAVGKRAAIGFLY